MSGFRRVAGGGFWCPACEARLDAGGVEGWVREAERARDEAYSAVEGDEFGRIAREECQREVYRRRKVLYELRDGLWMPAARPEMVLVVYDAGKDSYDCRIFYKEPRPLWALEQFEVGADGIQEMRCNPEPVARLALEKVEEFHLLRQKAKASASGSPAPNRRVFYADEL